MAIQFYYGVRERGEVLFITAAFAVRMLILLRVNRDFGNTRPRQCCSVGGNGVVHPLSDFPAVNDAAVTQDFHVMRESRLTQREFLKQFTRTSFSALQQLQNLYAVLVAERLENNRHLLVGKLHCFTSENQLKNFYASII